MNLRTIFSASAAATLLVIGPGWALAGPSADLSGDVTGSGDTVVNESGLTGSGDGSGSVDASVDVPGVPEAPEAPEGDAPEIELPDAPEASEASQHDAPELPEAPEADLEGHSTGDGQADVEAPAAPELPELPELTAPSTDQGPKTGSKPALDKGSADGSAKAEASFSTSGSVSGGNPPEADHDSDGDALVEAGGHQIATP